MLQSPSSTSFHGRNRFHHVRPYAILALLGLALFLAALGMADADPASATQPQPRDIRYKNNPDPIHLGMSAPFSGPTRGLGIELYRGSMAYFEHLNRTRGGLFGRPVRIQPMDDHYDPDSAIRNTINFIEDQSILLLFDYVGTPTVTSILPLIKKFSHRDIHLLFPFTGAQPHREDPYLPYVFNLRASYRQETSGIVNLMAALNRTRVAVFYQADAYGRSGWDGVRRTLKQHGRDIVSEATYRRGAQFEDSMAEQVSIILQGKPDVVVSVGAYEPCAAFIRDARDAGLDVPIANLSFVGSENLLALLEREGQTRKRDYTTDLINTQVVPSYEDTSLPAVREYRALMDSLAPDAPDVSKEPYTPLRYSFVSFEGFLNAKALAEAITAFGEVPARRDLPLVFEDISNHDIGIDVPVTFSSLRHQGLSMVYYTTVEDGKFVPIRNSSRWAKP